MNHHNFGHSTAHAFDYLWAISGKHENVNSYKVVGYKKFRYRKYPKINPASRR